MPRSEVATLVVIASLIGLVANATAQVDARATTRVLTQQRRAGDYWQGLVASGVAPDSATELALQALRTRLHGTAVRVEYPLLPDPPVDSLWQAMYLNPFRADGAQTPRTQAEADAIRATQDDLRRIREVGVRDVRAQLRREDVRLWALVAAASLVLGGLAVWRRQRRRIAIA
ncbi:MAG: hypothetical protein K2R93_02075 [Gemmatimonadaceae bacterium]|nr:hypothetical protein [Gemmatimonadaceae bacterium]